MVVTAFLQFLYYPWSMKSLLEHKRNMALGRIILLFIVNNQALAAGTRMLSFNY
jgi:hypothetical protein